MPINLFDAFKSIGSDACQSFSANTNQLQDGAGNQINAVGSSSFSTLVATNHNFKGATPTFILCQENNGASAAAAAAAMSIGTITATQYTPAGTANACTAIAGVF